MLFWPNQGSRLSLVLSSVRAQLVISRLVFLLIISPISRRYRPEPLLFDLPHWVLSYSKSHHPVFHVDSSRWISLRCGLYHPYSVYPHYCRLEHAGRVQRRCHPRKSQLSESCKRQVDLAFLAYCANLQWVLGGIGGLNLTPGLYKWTSGVTLSSSITVSGSSLDSVYPCSLLVVNTS